MVRDYYLFEDEFTCEEFFVQAETEEEARLIANFNFEEPILIDVLTEDESEWYPYDVY